MTLLTLTISPNEPLVIGDGDIVISVVRTQGSQVKIRINADTDVQVNRGSIYLGKKLIPEYNDITEPVVNLWEENATLMGELLEQAAANLHLETIDYEKLPERTKRIFSLITPKLYMKVIELFLAKFLYIHNLQFNEESVEIFKNDFLKGE